MTHALSARDSLQMPMLFCRIGWMSRYRGLARNETIVGGGVFVKEHGYGHEMFNFEPFRGSVYGYVQPPHDNINISRLGASSKDESIIGVLVIWVAQGVIVGWYQDATVYRYHQESAVAQD